MSPIRPPVTLVGRRDGAEDQRLRDFLTRTAQPYEWVEAGTPAASELLASADAADAELPALLDGGELIRGATVERVAELWRVYAGPQQSTYELIIVGAGPAGLAAAVYAASDGLRTLIIEEDVPGGQASHTSLIENFFGFPDGIGGAELSRLAGRQAERFGAELVFLRGVTGSSLDSDSRFRVQIAGGFEAEAPVGIAAPGMHWRRLGVEGIDALLGRGVYYGAGRSEVAQCVDEDVIVVGAGNSAGQAAIAFANAGARVKLLVRGIRLGKSMSAYLVERIAAHSLVDVRLQTEVEAVEAKEDWLSEVGVTGPSGRERVPARMMFLCLGGVPRTGWAGASGVRLDSSGFILTGPDLLSEGRRPDGWPIARDPLALETSVPGLFAAGDARHGSAKRVAGAVGEGAMAAALAYRRLEEIERGRGRGA
jgi:thioredoxin reductase (NADPH)